MITIKKLDYAKNGKQILSNINLEILSGDTVAILGPNGAGKSSLLNCMAGLTKVKCDCVQYYYQSICQFTPPQLALKRAFLSQKVNVAFDCSVFDLIELGRYVYTLEDSQYNKQIIKKVMQLAGVSHLQNRKLSTLSGGELQRVHFARTIAQLWGKDIESNNNGEGFLLLMDEPVNNLDPYYQHELLDVAKRVCKELNATLITVLHDLNLASQYADKIVLMEQGKVVSYGKKGTVLTEQNLEKLYGIPVSIINTDDNIFIQYGKNAKEFKLLNQQHNESTLV